MTANRHRNDVWSAAARANS